MSEALRAAWGEVFRGRFRNGAGPARQTGTPSHAAPENRDDLDPPRVNRSPADCGVLYLPADLFPDDPALATRFLADLRRAVRVEITR